jgi:hypothetical protein
MGMGEADANSEKVRPFERGRNRVLLLVFSFHKNNCPCFVQERKEQTGKRDECVEKPQSVVEGISAI